MNNQEFLEILKGSFQKFLTTGSRSNEKLKILHGAVAQDLSERLGDEYKVKSLGFGNNKEGKILGRYIDKNVDIVIEKQERVMAGIGVKFVMQNYAQNSNNYFENMLGETANIRSKNIPYFQIFIIPESLPYYENSGKFKKWEYFNTHHINKYKILSNDNDEVFLHTPTKTLLYVLKLPELVGEFLNKQFYTDYYSHLVDFRIEVSENDYGEFGDNLIMNDYELFIEKVKNRIWSI